MLYLSQSSRCLLPALHPPFTSRWLQLITLINCNGMLGQELVQLGPVNLTYYLSCDSGLTVHQWSSIYWIHRELDMTIFVTDCFLTGHVAKKTQEPSKKTSSVIDIDPPNLPIQHKGGTQESAVVIVADISLLTKL